jgi:hypothetical protein
LRVIARSHLFVHTPVRGREVEGAGVVGSLEGRGREDEAEGASRGRQIPAAVCAAIWTKGPRCAPVLVAHCALRLCTFLFAAVLALRASLLAPLLIAQLGPELGAAVIDAAPLQTAISRSKPPEKPVLSSGSVHRIELRSLPAPVKHGCIRVGSVCPGKIAPRSRYKKRLHERPRADRTRSEIRGGDRLAASNAAIQIYGLLIACFPWTPQNCIATFV